MENPVTEIPKVIKLLTQSVPSVQKQTIETYFTPSASFTHPFCRTGSFNGSRWLVLQIYRFYKIMSPRIEVEIKSVVFDSSNLLLYVSMHQTFRMWIIPFYSAPVAFTTLLKLTEEQGPQQSSCRHRRSSSERHLQFQPITRSPLSGQTSSDDFDIDADGLPSPRRSEQQHDQSPSSLPSLSPVPSGPRRLYYVSSQEDLYQTSEFMKFVMPFGIGVSLVTLWHIYATLFCVISAFVWWPVTWAEEQGYMPLKGKRPRNIRKPEEVGMPGGLKLS